jgi:hypothetical protein
MNDGASKCILKEKYPEQPTLLRENNDDLKDQYGHGGIKCALKFPTKHYILD